MTKSPRADLCVGTDLNPQAVLTAQPSGEVVKASNGFVDLWAPSQVVWHLEV